MSRMKRRLAPVAMALLVLVAVVAGCSGGGSSMTPSQGLTPTPMPSATPLRTASPAPSPTATAGESPIQHIVVIVQENRTVDNLFNGFPGADTAQNGNLSNGTTVALHSTGFAVAVDISHAHTNWWKQYAGGQMFFDLGSPSNQPPTYPYAFVQQSETGPYWTLAQAYTFTDRTFQSNTGPSFPSHQYLIAGQSNLADENPTSGKP